MQQCPLSPPEVQVGEILCLVILDFWDMHSSVVSGKVLLINVNSYDKEVVPRLAFCDQ